MNPIIEVLTPEGLNSFHVDRLINFRELDVNDPETLGAQTLIRIALPKAELIIYSTEDYQTIKAKIDGYYSSLRSHQLVLASRR